MNTARVCAAIAVLVVGMVLLFEGTYPAVEEWIDGAYIALGAALILGYFPLIGDYLKRKLRAPATTTLAPVLLVLGLVMVYYGTTKAGLATPVLKLTFIAPGAALAAVSLVMLGRSLRRYKIMKGHMRKTSATVVMIVVLAIAGASCYFMMKRAEERVLSREEVLQEIREHPGDLRLGVDPKTVEIRTAELMDFEQLPEKEREFIEDHHEKVWVIEYECVGDEAMPGEVIFAGKMLVRRVIDAYTGERLLRAVPMYLSISRRQAIDVVKDYFGENFYKVENAELRPPTEQEVYSIRSFGREPPDLVWYVEVELEPVGTTHEELERAREACEKWGTKLYGEPLEFEHEWERMQWFIDLEKLGDRLRDAPFPYFGENGVIVMRGYGVEGYYEIAFRYDAPPTDAMMEEVFAAVNETAKEVGFDREVPVRFSLGCPGFYPRGARVLVNAYMEEILPPLEILV
jgi:hypothetical protein